MTTRQLVIQFLAPPVIFMAATLLGGCIRELHVHILESVGKPQRVERATTRPTTGESVDDIFERIRRGDFP